MASLERFLQKKLRLTVNRDKSAVDRPWKRSFLGYTVTVHRKPRLKVAPDRVKRLKTKLRVLFRAGRGRSLIRTSRDLQPIVRGWTAYYRLCDVKGTFETLDEWLRHRCRAIIWRHWKRPKTRYRELCKRGIDPERARKSTGNGRGPWWNARQSHMNQAIPNRALRLLGVPSFLDQFHRLALSR